MPKVNARLLPDTTAMEINMLGDDDRFIVGATFDALRLDNVIAGLVDIRSKMMLEANHDFPEGEQKLQHQEHRATDYRLGLDPFSGAILLSLRSPVFGWLSLSIAQEEMERMLRSLQESRARVAPHNDTKN
jgi:hypothetical protein